MSKSNILIIGSGWAGSTLAASLSSKKYSITLVSPETTTPYTPLLASAACGVYDFGLVETPVRRSDKRIKVIKGRVEGIDFEKKIVTCTPTFSDLSVKDFTLDYDIIVIAPGCTNQTFNTHGVTENCIFIRNATDARKVSNHVQDLFEKASIPGLSPQEQRALLHFVIVGAGPTGIEVSSELSDLFVGDYAELYPHLKDKVSITIHDVAEKVLSGFDGKLQDYAMSSFSKRHVEVLTGSHIEKVEKGAIYTKEKGKIETGLVIWAAGNKATPLVERLDVKKSDGTPRILTDSFLRVYSPSSSIIEGAYALGDAADVEDASLPTTAEVACQKGTYLAKLLNSGEEFSKKFAYEQTAIVAYLGQNDGVISGKKDYSGAQAWIAWRSKNFLWTRTWRQKVLIVVGWGLDVFTGRWKVKKLSKL